LNFHARKGYPFQNKIVESEKLISACKDQLQLVLSFFSRVESRSSVVLAIDTGMAAFLAGSAPPMHSLSLWMMVASITTMISLGVSVLFLYFGSAPNLKGGEESRVYFAEIAKHREHKFIEDFKAQSEEEYANDLLGQAWRNAKILSIKFHCLKWAFRFMAFAITPWLVSLALFAAFAGTHTTFFRL
jgi:Family of unknown function (DUF5706)